jgi:iron complex outermembrane receptor protein
MLVCLFLSLFTQAQKIALTGKITDDKGQPVSGASVRILSSAAGTSSNNEGLFSLTVNANDVLTVSHTGYATQEVPVKGHASVAITLQQTSAEMQTVMVGTRRAGRVKTHTTVPVDIVNVNAVSLPTARLDLTTIINDAAPSLNYNKQSGSDGADHIDLATLRGLGPDQTLVLINGKRRHQTAFIAVFGTRGRGNSGTDLSAIPISAIDRVEILRDGASAQYGSDAIAGVINLILKKNVGHFSANAGYASYYDKKYNPYFKRDYGQYVYGKAFDGNAFTFNANYGVPVGKQGGFINLTANFLTQGKTFRQALDTNANSKDFMYTNIYRRAHGDGSLQSGGGFFNAELPFNGSKTSFYSFGGYNYKSSDAYAFTRNFSARPDRFPTDNSGAFIPVPGIIQTTSDGERYFNPHIQTHIKDYSLAAGIKGVMGSGWNWDFSNTVGKNDFHFYGDKTFNASLGAAQTHFDDGGFNFLQNTVNLNFGKEIGGIAAGFNLAMGAEYRYERYDLFAGEEGSYKNYQPNKTVTNADGDVLNVAGGSQGFPGYQPNDEVTANRSTIGAYVDAELDVTNAFLLGGAVRFENYSDFGFTHNYKLAARYKMAPGFNLRGSVSTGFRAPSLQQINFSSTFTTVQGGTIAEVKIAPNYSPITKAAGIAELKQEKSVNASFGFSATPANGLTITLDGYWVKVKDRVVLSGQFDASDPTLDPSLTSALQNLNVSLAQFFANAVNTTNRGIDLVIDFNRRFGKNSFRALFTGNIQNMDIDKINVPAKLNDTKEHRLAFLSDREQDFILASAPKSKFGLNLEYGLNRFTVGTRLTYFGKMTILGYGEDGLGINPTVPTDADPDIHVKDQYIYNGKLVSDLYVTYRFSKNLAAFAGSDNLFNVHPDLGIAPGARGWAFNNETGGPWDAVQMGGNGRRFFARLAVDF